MPDFQTTVGNEIPLRPSSQDANPQTAGYYLRYTGVAKLTTERSPTQVAGDLSHSELADRDVPADHAWASLIDGSRAFTGTVAGVTPSADVHLTTKAYVDDLVIPVDYVPDSLNVGPGSLEAGDVDSLATLDDDDAIEVDEANNTPGFIIEINYASVLEIPTRLDLHVHYTGSAGHTVNVQIYDQVDEEWDTLGTIPDEVGFEYLTYDITNGAKYIKGDDTVEVRLNHVSAGNPTHEIFVDYALLRKIPIGGGGGITDHGGLQDLDADDHNVGANAYHTDARGDARYYTETELDAGQLDNRYFRENEFLASSAGAGDSGKPIKLDAAGHVDATMINDGDIDHANIANIGGYTHDQIDTHIDDTNNPHGVTVTQLGALWSSAAIDDHAIARGAGGVRGMQTSTATIADTGAMSVPAIGDGGIINHDLNVGNPSNYGMIKIGDASFGRTSYKTGSIDLDGTIICKNTSGPVTGEVEFIWTESTGGTARFALPKSGVGNATYNSRSMFCIGPAPADTDFVTVGYWQGLGHFLNLACDTSGDGADFGVQNDVEIGGECYVDTIEESTAAAGVTIDSVLIKDGLIGAAQIGATGSVSDAEFDYLDGVTSAIQTQLAAKQPLDADLTSIAAISAGGFLAHINPGEYTVRGIVGTSNQITVANQLGATGNPTISIPTNPTLPGTTTLTPLLAGNLDVNGKSIVSVSNGDIVIAPHGTGDVVIGAASSDPTIKFYGAANDGTMMWQDDEDRFKFVDNIWMDETSKIFFRDTTQYIHSSDGNMLDLVAADEIELTAPQVSVSDDFRVHTDVLAVDAANNRVGIGTVSPNFQLQVVKSGASGGRGLATSYHTNNTPGASFEALRSRGTFASPTALQNADLVGLLSMWGHDGSAYQRSGYVGFKVDGAVSGGVVPMAYVVATGSASFGTERWRTDSEGRTVFGGTTPDGSAIVELQSTTRGFLLPSMTTAQKDLIGFPATNLLLIDSDLGRIDRYDGSNYHNVSDSPTIIQYGFDGDQSVTTWMRLGVVQASSTTGMYMARAGSIVAHSTSLTISTATSGDVTFEVRINNSNEATLENEFASGGGTGVKGAAATVARDSVAFSAGDLVTVVALETGDMVWTAVMGYIEVVFDT